MPASPKRTPAGAILTSATMELFRVSSLILNVGDRMSAHLGLTGARWQILGSIVRGGTPRTVAGMARNLGTNRQNVQRIVHDLERMEYLRFEPNPRHRRAPLVALTPMGEEAYQAAMALQAPWANSVTRGLDLKDLEVFLKVLLALRERLEKGAGKSGETAPENG